MLYDHIRWRIYWGIGNPNGARPKHPAKRSVNGNRTVSNMAIETSIKSEQQPARKSASQTKARVKKMTRADWNFWLDVFLLLNFMALIWAMVVVQFVFPAGPQSHGWLLWGWTYVDWCNVQFAVLCVMVAAILLHVMLHWSWVSGSTLRL